MAIEGIGAMPEGLPGGAAAGKGTADGLTTAARLQILSTEHWSLLATRSLTWSEAFSRASMFLSALTGAVVALALVAQAMEFGQGFLLFALLLLPVVLFLGIATFVRLVAINMEDTRWVIGMNRLRRAYLDMAPDLEDYFVSGTHDDVAGVMLTFGATAGPGQFVHGFVTTPGMLAVVVGVVAGVLAGVVAGTVGADVVPTIVIGAITFAATVALLLVYQYRATMRFAGTYEPRFPRE